MNQKEVRELKRRFLPNKNAISRIYGCYVDPNRRIIAQLDESLGLMPEDEAEKYLSLLKKALSGTLGKNLIDIVFATGQVVDSQEHRLLTRLRDSQLKDAEVRQEFYDKVIASLDMEDSGYLILLAHDTYDVPYRSRDDQVQADASDQVFSYLVCCICPIKERRGELGYFPGDNEFHSCSSRVVSAPEVGFLFPAFDDRAANIYNALYYARKPDALHQELIDAVFHTDPPMSAADQRLAFETALSESLGETCSVEVVQAIHEQLRERLEIHKESRDPEPPSITQGELSAVLAEAGATQEQVQVFRDRCDQEFGRAPLNPANLIDSRRFEVKTGQATVTISPECSGMLETQAINGRRYLLVPMDGTVEVNGFALEGTGGEGE